MLFGRYEQSLCLAELTLSYVGGHGYARLALEYMLKIIPAYPDSFRYLAHRKKQRVGAAYQLLYSCHGGRILIVRSSSLYYGYDLRKDVLIRSFTPFKGLRQTVQTLDVDIIYLGAGDLIDLKNKVYFCAPYVSNRRPKVTN